MKFYTLLAAGFLLAAGVRGAEAPRLVPGPQSDGSVLLHNQWPIRPVGTQVALGDFPVALAIDPSGRFAAVLHAGYGAHEIKIIDLKSRAVVNSTRLRETFAGIAFSADGRRLVCSGGTERLLHVFDFADGQLEAPKSVKLPEEADRSVVGGLALAKDGRTAFVSTLFASKIMRVDLDSGSLAWAMAFDPPEAAALESEKSEIADIAPNDNPVPKRLADQTDPYYLALDERHHRLYASLWAKSDVAVLDSETGKLVARLPVGLHPNEIVLNRDGSRLFVSNGGRNSVTVIDTASGQSSETLNSAFMPGDQPGSTPDSLCLSPDGDTLYIANAYNNNVAVFDVSEPAHGKSLGFIPTGWFPTALRTSPNGKSLLIVSARGLEAHPNPRVPPPASPQPQRVVTVKAAPNGPEDRFPYIGSLFLGSLAVVDLPKTSDREEALKRWTAIAEQCRPVKPAPADSGNPIPAARGATSPIRYVLYIIKENRTYDEVFGDMKEGNGDPSICIFPEKVTPNLHKLARQFVLLDNLFANAEVSASGHEWSMAAYSSEFVEKMWPVNYSRSKTAQEPYPAEGSYAAAVPALGYIWDQARAAGVSFRDYGEFVRGDGTEKNPSKSNLPALEGHVDPYYHGWNLNFSDLDRIPRFLSELRRFEAAGDMPRFQILRLPNDHTQAAKARALTPEAMVAQNDLAVGKVVEAVSHSRFWPQTAIFIIEDDAQNGPDHVDAHRTEALVLSPYTKHHFVDSTAYTTCSMLSTMELILGMAPMSQFDALASPMRASFQGTADLSPYEVTPNQVSLSETNPAGTKRAALSAKFNFAHEDAIDDQAFNRVIWAAMRGEDSPMPAPIHAAFVRSLPAGDDDDDGD